MSAEKVREDRVRRQLWKQCGCLLRKSRTRLGANNFGGYAIVSEGAMVAGRRFELDLEDVEQFILEYHAKGPGV